MIGRKTTRIEARFVCRGERNERILVTVGGQPPLYLDAVKWTKDTPAPYAPNDDTRIFDLPYGTPHVVCDGALPIDGARR